MNKYSILFICTIFFSCSNNKLVSLYKNYCRNIKNEINFTLIDKNCTKFFNDQNRPKNWHYNSIEVTDSFFIIGFYFNNGSKESERLYLNKKNYKVIRHQLWTGIQGEKREFNPYKP